MNKIFTTAAALAAAVVLNGCTVKVDPTASGSSRTQYRSVRDSSAYDESAASVPDDVSSAADAHEEDSQDTGSDITMPEDDELTLLIGDDHSSLLEDACSLFDSLGGELTVETADSDLMYDTIAVGEISGKPIDAATFDNGMMFPYLAVEGVISPIDREMSLPQPNGEMSETADMFSLNNWHYVMPLKTQQAYRLLYDTETLERYGLDDPAELDDGEWTLEKLCEMSVQFSAKGGKTPLAGNFGEPLYISVGEPLVKYERDPAGFFNNLFDPNMAQVAEQLYQLTQQDMILDSGAADPAESLKKGALFYSADLFTADNSDLPETVKTAPVPTLEGLDRSCELKVYGLTLMSGSKHIDAAECYFRCAAKTVQQQSGGRFEEEYAAYEPEKMVYPYDKGISPGVSYSPAHMNEDDPLCVSEIIYNDIESADDHGGVCAYYSHLVLKDVTTLNNKISEDIYGD